jgi:hypothetical protein
VDSAYPLLPVVLDGLGGVMHLNHSGFENDVMIQVL